MQRLKIVFSGPMGAGKTQAISSLSDIPVVSTEVKNTDLGTNAKLLTTVGMDYGELTLRRWHEYWAIRYAGAGTF